MYSIDEIEKITGISAYTLNKWKKQGRLIPAILLSNQIKRYSEEQLLELLTVELK